MIMDYQEKTPRIHPTAWVAPTAVVVGDVVLEENANCWFGAVLRGDEDRIQVGTGSNIQDNAVLHADAGSPVHIGKDVTVGHAAVIHGCTLEDGVLVGMGAIVLNGATIRKGAIIAAGAVVLSQTEIPPNTIAAGTPAKVIKEMTPEAAEKIRENAYHYVKLSQNYAQNEPQKIKNTKGEP